MRCEERPSPPRLLLPHQLFDLAELLLNLAGCRFDLAFGFQLTILAEFPGLLRELAFAGGAAISCNCRKPGAYSASASGWRTAAAAFVRKAMKGYSAR